MEQYIVSDCHKNSNLHATTPKCQLVCRRLYALTQAELIIRPRSATARDPTNSCVPICEPLRRHTSTTNTRMLPSVPTTKTIHSTTTLTYVNQVMFENHLAVAQLAVVPVEFQSPVSAKLFSFANGTGLVKFISAITRSSISWQRRTNVFLLSRKRWIFRNLRCLFLLVASCFRCVLWAVEQRTNDKQQRAIFRYSGFHSALLNKDVGPKIFLTMRREYNDFRFLTRFKKSISLCVADLWERLRYINVVLRIFILPRRKIVYTSLTRMFCHAYWEYSEWLRNGKEIMLMMMMTMV